MFAYIYIYICYNNKKKNKQKSDISSKNVFPIKLALSLRNERISMLDRCRSWIKYCQANHVTNHVYVVRHAVKLIKANQTTLWLLQWICHFFSSFFFLFFSPSIFYGSHILLSQYDYYSLYIPLLLHCNSHLLS